MILINECDEGGSENRWDSLRGCCLSMGLPMLIEKGRENSTGAKMSFLLKQT
jgi:hypothetical protein